MPINKLLPIKAPLAMPYLNLSRWFKASVVGLALAAAPLGHLANAGSQQRETPIVVAVRRARSAVVNISSEKRPDARSVWEGALSDTQRVNGMGSGVIVDERGYIITNAHVVDRVTSLKVRLSDGSQYDATRVSEDRATDLALIKIDAGKPLPVAAMGSSSDLMLGETVIAVGNAFGYNDTVTSGLVSALGRTVRLNDEMTYYDLIQTSADINPGNSGGALLNIDGELVGVNVAIRAGAQGISFAIPVDTVRRVAGEMLNIRRINQTWHGMQFTDAMKPGEADNGLLVQKVDGPSQKIGIKPGDRVVRVGETPIHSALEFERSLLDLHAGDHAALMVRRGTSDEPMSLTIEESPRSAESSSDVVWRRLGLRLSVTDAYQIQRHQSYLRGGMYIAQVQPGSPAAAAGVRSGDFLLGLQKWETLNYENVLFVLTQYDQTPYDPMVVHVLRNGEPFELQLRLTAATKDAATKRR